MVAVIVVELPEQIDVLVATNVIVGVGLTITEIVLVPIQPNPFVPLTVYVVLTAGVTLTVALITPPGFHV